MHAYLHTHIQAHDTHASAALHTRFSDNYTRIQRQSEGGGGREGSKRTNRFVDLFFFSLRPQGAEAAPPCTAKRGVGGGLLYSLDRALILEMLHAARDMCTQSFLSLLFLVSIEPN